MASGAGKFAGVVAFGAPEEGARAPSFFRARLSRFAGRLAELPPGGKIRKPALSQRERTLGKARGLEFPNEPSLIWAGASTLLLSLIVCAALAGLGQGPAL